MTSANSKANIYLSILLIFSAFLFINSPVYSQGTCDDNLCIIDGGPGSYACNGDEMCCQGNGCPTFKCTQENYTLKFDNSNGWQCCSDLLVQFGSGGNTLPKDDCLAAGFYWYQDLCYQSSDACTEAEQEFPNDKCWCSSFCGGGNSTLCSIYGGGSTGGSSCGGAPGGSLCLSPTGNAQIGEGAASVLLDFESDGSGWGGQTSECGNRYYQMQIATNTSFSNITWDSSALQYSDWPANGVFPNYITQWSVPTSNIGGSGQLYWRVRRLTSKGGPGPWSGACGFISNSRPPTAQLSIPADNQVYLFEPTGTNPVISNIYANAQDASTSANYRLKHMRFNFRKWNGSAWPAWVGTDEYTAGSPAGTGNWCGDAATCSVAPTGANASRFRNFIPAEEGRYQITVNAVSNDADFNSGPVVWCSGNPDLAYPNSLVSDCDPNGADIAQDVCFVAAPAARITTPLNNAVIQPNVPTTFNMVALDRGSNMTTTSLFRRKVNADGTYGPAIHMGNSPYTFVSGERGNASVNFTWAPAFTDLGRWQIYMNVNDSNTSCNSRCTGHPVPPIGWYDCGRAGSGWVDMIEVDVANTAPYCFGVRGPNTLQGGKPGLYNVDYQDLNQDDVTVSWSTTTASCSLSREPISRVVLRARGTPADGEYPLVDIVAGDATGAKQVICSNVTIGNSAYANYSCPFGGIGASTIDVVFKNDKLSGTEDMNVYVDFIDIHYVNSDQNPFRTIQSNARTNTGDYVIYDRALSSDAFSSPYDGVDQVPYPFPLDPLNPDSVAMLWDGSLRFPVPLNMSNSNPSVNCNLVATLRDGTNTTTCTGYSVNVCGSAPEAPQQVTPDDGETLPGGTPTLIYSHTGSWGDVCSGSPEYEFRVYVKAKGEDITCSTNKADYDSPVCRHTGGSVSACDAVGFDVQDRTYCWMVEASNGQFSTMSPTAYEYTMGSATSTQSWFTALGGSIFANATIVQGLPGAGSGGWADINFTYELPFETRAGFFTNSDYRFSGSGDPRSESGFWYHNAENSINSLWPYEDSDLAAPPADAIQLPFDGQACADIFVSNANGQRPAINRVYTIEYNCLQEAMNATPEYTLNNSNEQGVAILYVTNQTASTQQILVENNFKSSGNPRYQVLLVLPQNVNFVVSELVNTGEGVYPTGPLAASSNANVNLELSILSLGEVLIDGEGSTGDPIADPDYPVIIEGPVIAKNVVLNRNLGSNNAYPSEIFVYNPVFLYNLTKTERNATDFNRSGLFVFDTYWEPVE